MSKLSIAVTPGNFNALVTNNHIVLAPDGLVILSARAMNRWQVSYSKWFH
jgi:hypothetical protein